MAKITTKLSTAELRKRNRNMVFQYLYDAQEAKTKQNIAFDLSLSLPTVTQNLSDLMSAGLLKYIGIEQSTGGRRARTLSIAPEARFALGVELSPKHIRVLAVDLKLNELGYERIDCLFSAERAYRERVAGLLRGFADKFSLDPSLLLGIGITLPGIVSEERDIIEVSPVLHVHKMSLSLLTQDALHPIWVENDASAGGFAELWSRSGMKNMAYLFVGKGVGGALVVNGKPYEGEHRRSAEFGHMTIVPGGKACSCGQRGCLEAYCSTARLTDDLGIQLEDFSAGIQAGDARYDTIWSDYLDHLAMGVSNLRTMMDCDVVLGGMLVPYMPAHMAAMRARLAALDPFGGDGSYFHLANCGAKANCIGGALHFIHDFIQNI